MLKCLHICQRDDLATGGAARVAVEYVKRLSTYGIDAHCLFLYGPPGYFQTELGDRAHYLEIVNSRDFINFRRLTQFIQSFQPQILHHHDGLLWSHTLTFLHPSVVKITHAHEGVETKPPLFSRSRFAAWMQRQSTDLLICITESTRKSQIDQGEYLPDRTYVLYNGVDCAQFHPPTGRERTLARSQFGLPSDAHVVGFVGRLHCEMKGTDDFLRVISLLPPEFWALVVGAGPDFEQLNRLAVKLEIADRVIFTGLLEQTVIAYHALDIFALTSHWEPFGLVVAEAMACQVPVIGFACVGGVSELLHSDTGQILLDRNIQAMAEAIIAAVRHPEQSQQRRTCAESLLQHRHNWDRNTSELADLYKKVV